MPVLWNGIALLCFAAGHAELWVAAINRLHARRLSCRVLTYCTRAHYLALVAFPLALMGRVGLVEPGVLRGGSWSDLSWGWSACLVVCGGGFVSLVVHAARWRLRKVPAALSSNHTTRIDVARELGRRPLGAGRHRWMARLPFNEAFLLEITEKTLHPPRLPPAWDGLRILHLSDAHFLGTVDRPWFEHVFERLAGVPVDLVVFTGDLCDNLALLDWLPATFGRLDAPLGKFFLLGNHDWYLDADAIRRAVEEFGWTHVGGRTRVVPCRGHSLVLAGDEHPWLGPHPDFAARGDVPRTRSAADVDDSSAAADEFRLLLSHSPDSLEWARRNAVDLMLAGHTHGGQVVLPILGPIYSPSRRGVTHAGGTFHEPPTLMHVSRGLGGRQPLRWNCPPEATVITLRAAAP